MKSVTVSPEGRTSTDWVMSRPYAETVQVDFCVVVTPCGRLYARYSSGGRNPAVIAAVSGSRLAGWLAGWLMSWAYADSVKWGVSHGGRVSPASR